MIFPIIVGRKVPLSLLALARGWAAFLLNGMRR